MSEAVERLKTELARLTADERADLAQFLLSSLEDIADSDDLIAELDRRSEELTSGRVQAVPAHEVIDRLRHEYP